MISVFLTPLLQIKVKKDNANKRLDILRDISLWQKTRDKQAANRILQYLSPTINSALKSFAPGQLLSLKIQAAKLALSSMLTYDPEKKVDPSTYAYNNLQRLNRIRRLRLSIIHVPLGALYKQQLVQRIAMKLLDLLGRLPTILELADATGISLKMLLKLQAKTQTIVNDSSAINAVTGQSTFAVKNVSDKDFIDYTYKSIGPLLQKIMLWSLGIKGKPILSNTLIAARLKISPGAVSQRKNKITQTLALLRSLL